MPKRNLRSFAAILTAAAMLTSSFALTVSAAGVNEPSGAAVEVWESGHIQTQWSKDGKWYYSVLNDGSAVIMGCVWENNSYSSDDTPDLVEYRIPESVDGHTVTVIGGDQYYSRPFGNFMFNKCNLFIPSTVTYIHPSFLSCISLESTITIDSENPAYTVVDDIIYSKDKKTLVSYRGSSEEFDVASGVETIGAYAFANRDVKTVRLPDSVKRIENNAFFNDGKLESVKLNEGLDFIGSYAFSGTNLTEIKFPSTLKTIGTCAFSNLKNLKSVELNSGLTTVGEYAFGNLELTELIKVPGGCTGNVSGYRILNNDFIFELKNDDSGAYYFVLTDYRPSKAQEELVIPGSVLGIPVKCVEDNFYYYNCSDEEKECFDKVKKLIVSEGVEEFKKFPQRLKNLEGIVFPSTLQSISNKAFSYNLNVKKVTLPKGVKIGEDVFSITSGDFRYSIIADEETGEYGAEIVDYVRTSKDMVIPSEIDGYPVVSFKSDSHYYLEDGEYESTRDWGEFDSVVFPDSIKSIDMDYGYFGTRSVTLPAHLQNAHDLSDLTLIKDDYEYTLFFNEETKQVEANIGAGSSLTVPYDSSFEIPNSVDGIKITGIAAHGFSRLPYLEINIPEFIERIGGSAFERSYRCTAVTIPDSVTSIGSGAFSDCYNLQKVVLSKNITKITVDLFNGCSLLSDIKLPNGITEIEERSFRNCESLTSLEIPSTVRTIRRHAFLNSGLKGMEIPSTVTQVGRSLFEDEEGDDISQEEIETTIPKGSLVSGDFAYVISDDGVHITRYLGFSESVVIPSTLAGKTVTGLEEDVFYVVHHSYPVSGFYGDYIETGVRINPFVKTVTLPSTINYIAGTAFRSTNLVDGNFIYNYKLDDATKKVEAVVSGVLKLQEVLKIPDNINGTPVTEITNISGGHSIGENVTKAYESAKDYESALYSDNNEYYGETEKVDPTILKHIEIPDSVKKIGALTFAECTELQEINIPDSVECIECGAFYHCDSLKEINIPASVTSFRSGMIIDGWTYLFDITGWAYPDREIELTSPFIGCDNLKKITVDSDNPSFTSDDGVLFTNDMSVLIQYPIGKTDKKYTIPSSVKAIVGNQIGNPVISACEGAFSYNTYLEQLIIPEGLEEIGSGAFAGCISLEKLDFPKSVTTIGLGILAETNANPGNASAGIQNWEIRKKPVIGVYRGTVAEQVMLSYPFNVEYLDDKTAPISDTSSDTDTETESDTATETDMATDTDTDTSTEIDTATDTGTSTETDMATDTDTSTETDTGAETDASTETDTATDKDTSTETDTGAETDTSTETDTGAETDASTETDTGAETDTSTETDTGAETDTSTETDTGAETDTSTETDTGAETDTSTETDTETDTDSDAYEDFEYEILDDGTVSITTYYGFETELTIPGEINGKKVTSIGEFAFSSCTALEKITLPDSVTSIGDYAFSNCTSLENITLPDSVTSIGEYAFADCTSLESITIPDSVTSIDEFAFDECDLLTVYGSTGSYAEKYANDNNITFEPIGGKPATDTDDKPEPLGVLGDLDGDGQITSADALVILRMSVGAEEANLTLADVDGDGQITSADALAVLRASVGADDGSKVGQPIAA